MVKNKKASLAKRMVRGGSSNKKQQQSAVAGDTSDDDEPMVSSKKGPSNRKGTNNKQQFDRKKKNNTKRRNLQKADEELRCAIEAGMNRLFIYLKKKPLQRIVLIIGFSTILGCFL